MVGGDWNRGGGGSMAVVTGIVVAVVMAARTDSKHWGGGGGTGEDCQWACNQVPPKTICTMVDIAGQSWRTATTSQ